jgi:hypothetical protein
MQPRNAPRTARLDADRARTELDRLRDEHPPPPVAVCPVNPPAPALSQVPSETTYSWSVSQAMKRWGEMLTSGKTTP